MGIEASLLCGFFTVHNMASFLISLYPGYAEDDVVRPVFWTYMYKPDHFHVYYNYVTYFIYIFFSYNFVSAFYILW